MSTVQTNSHRRIRPVFRRLAGLPRFWLIAAAVCFLAAAVFRFALIGYGTMALFFAFLGAVVLCYLMLSVPLKIILTVLLLAGTALFFRAEIPVIRAARGEPAREADYLIVLGAGVNGAVPSLSMENRLTAARAYLEAHPGCAAVVTGGQGPGETVAEAQAMYDWLTRSGISPDRIIREPRASSTLENLAFSLSLIPDADTARLAVCSSEYHLYRAELMAADLGVSLFGVPAKTTLPLLKVNYFMREALGVVHYKVFGR